MAAQGFGWQVLQLQLPNDPASLLVTHSNHCISPALLLPLSLSHPVLSPPIGNKNSLALFLTKKLPTLQNVPTLIYTNLF